MDLKDAIESVKYEADEANSAFHAGHPEKVGKCFARIKDVINKAFREHDELLGDVKESATSEKSAETLEETQAKVSAPGVHPAVIDPAAAAREIGYQQPASKPTQ